MKRLTNSDGVYQLCHPAFDAGSRIYGFLFSQDLTELQITKEHEIE